MSARTSDSGASGGGDLDFESLVELHYAALYRFALSLTRSESDAGDLVQDTFLTWASKGHQLREASKVKTWLFTALHRKFLMSRRHESRFPHLEISHVETELPAIEPHTLNHLDAPAVLQLLSRVDPQYQAVIALFYLEDYSYNEIATVLEIPLGTVKSRLARGLTQLKELVRRASAPGQSPEQSTS